MAEEIRPLTPTGKHAPVSNQPVDEVLETVKKPVLQIPSQGERAGASEAVRGEFEPVAGCRPLEAMTANLWAMPEISGLRNIREASFGPLPPMAETVHGPDNRIEITNPSNYPWRMIAFLLITAADNSIWTDTGWFIGPHTLMTAGHAVYIRDSGVPDRDGWVKRIQVMPGRNGGTLPYGSVTSMSFRSVVGWTQHGDANYNYGAIVIPTELGNTVGWFGFGVWPDADLLGCTMNIAGYPGDKPRGGLWYAYGKIASVNAMRVHYNIDTGPGQSGSPVYRIIKGSRYAVALHNSGGAIYNSGTRIVMAVYNNMVAWKA